MCAGSGTSRYNSSLDTPRTNSAYMAPPPVSPGRKSTLLAICRQLPPSMQRAEWCLDDYIITDKLYKGYASMGECLSCGGPLGTWWVRTRRQHLPAASKTAVLMHRDCAPSAELLVLLAGCA
jgi:hypothetical protein